MKYANDSLKMCISLSNRKNCTLVIFNPKALLVCSGGFTVHVSLTTIVVLPLVHDSWGLSNDGLNYKIINTQGSGFHLYVHENFLYYNFPMLPKSLITYLKYKIQTYVVYIILVAVKKVLPSKVESML